jgi:hypothetical protein
MVRRIAATMAVRGIGQTARLLLQRFQQFVDSLMHFRHVKLQIESRLEVLKLRADQLLDIKSQLQLRHFVFGHCASPVGVGESIRATI